MVQISGHLPLAGICIHNQYSLLAACKSKYWKTVWNIAYFAYTVNHKTGPSYPDYLDEILLVQEIYHAFQAVLGGAFLNFQHKGHTFISLKYRTSFLNDVIKTRTRDLIVIVNTHPQPSDSVQRLAINLTNRLHIFNNLSSKKEKNSIRYNDPLAT